MGNRKGKSLWETACDRRDSFRTEGRDFLAAGVEYLRDLKKRFSGSGTIDEADVAEAFRIIQMEANLMGLGPGNDAFRVVDLLARCGKEIMDKGEVTLSEGSLKYIRQKMPVEMFIDACVERLEKAKEDGVKSSGEEDDVPWGGGKPETSW